MQRAIYKRLAAWLLVSVSALGIGIAGAAENLAPNDTSRLAAALDDLDQWVGDGINGEKWRKFLASAPLRKQIDKGAQADPAVVVRVLQRYRSGENGLELSRFAAVRGELESWLSALRLQYVENLPKLAWAARGDYVPLPRTARIAPVRAALRNHALELEQTLGTDNEFAKNWKSYLKWDLLQPHFSEDVAYNQKTLRELQSVLKRFRSNQPGLENPAFTKTADALDRYRSFFAWYARVQQFANRSQGQLSEEKLERRVYLAQLVELQKYLERHVESPTVETTRYIGDVLGTIEQLDYSPELVKAVRRRFGQSNFYAEISESAINQLAKRPVAESQPVRDVILGAAIRGTAHSRGVVSFHTDPADKHADLEVRLAGTIFSDTVGFKKPVRVSSRGNTSFVATKRIFFSDEQFLLMPADTSAQTKTNVCDVEKTGGKFGHRFVERVAWKKVYESKSLSEKIAAKRAEKKVSKRLDTQVYQAISQARSRYEHSLRPPLVRVGMFPEHLRLSSTHDSANAEATLASYEQLSTDDSKLQPQANSNVSIRLHETAVNNILPTIIGGAGLRQESEDEPPQVTGHLPPWLRKLANERAEERRAEIEKEQQDPAVPTEEENDQDEATEKFKPFSIRLDASHPASVSFDDQKVSLRVRIAELKSIEDGEESIRENWDLLVSYEVQHTDDSVVLRRTGDIEALPSGFDPRWSERLTGEQVATRSALAKVLNARSKEGEGFPEEVALPELVLPRPDDSELKPILRQLDCNDGWLTVGYDLP